jgi:glutamine cyclotransferase
LRIYIDIEMKKLTVTLLISLATVVACGGQKSTNNDKVTPVEAKPKRVFAELLDYNVVAEYPHSIKSYTQGLQYVDGTMWEGTGQEGDSHLQRIDLKTGKVDIVASLPNSEFGEGITHYKESIYQLTWESHVAYVYDLRGTLQREIKYRGEGWGITTDGERLYMSDGTSTIRVVNPDSFATESSICVTLDGQPLDMLNELEWIDGHIWANVYLTEAIVDIDPATGVVVGYVDMPALRTLLGNNPEAEAFNGVAYDKTSGHLFVTGKDWSKLFEIEIIK